MRTLSQVGGERRGREGTVQAVDIQGRARAPSMEPLTGYPVPKPQGLAGHLENIVQSRCWSLVATTVRTGGGHQRTSGNGEHQQHHQFGGP